VEQVAEILQVKAITVREMFRDKRIRGFKVGKAWRTTEKMLQEDIEAIARGDNPADLPMLGTEAPARDVPVPKRGRKKPAAEGDEGAPAKAAPKAKAKKPAKAAANGRHRKAEAAAVEHAGEEGAPEPQQFLF
jgi:excisionase family DNA binding protein